MVFANWITELDAPLKQRGEGLTDERFNEHMALLKRRINDGNFSPLERLALHDALYEHSLKTIATHRLNTAPSYPPIQITRSETRRTLRSAQKGRELDEWEQAFSDRLRNVSKQETVAGEVWLGLALWSAITRSTLCDPKLVKALRDHLIDDKPRLLPSIGGRLALRLEIDVASSAPESVALGRKRSHSNLRLENGAKWVHFFMPDGLTLALIFRWLTSDRALADRTKTIVIVRRALFDSCKPQFDRRELIDLCRDAIHLADDRPNALCSEALGEVARGSWEASGLDDCGHAICSGTAKAGKRQRSETVRLVDAQDTEAADANWGIHARLSQALARQGNRFPTRQDVSFALQPIIRAAEPGRIEHLLAIWYAHLIEDRNLRPSSVATYHGRIGARLIGTLGGIRLGSLDSDDFELFYRELVDDTRNPVTRAQIAGRLAQLHDFGYRHRAYKLPLLAHPVDVDDGTRSVRARHIPAHTLSAVRSELTRLVGGDPVLVDTLYAAILLAYRAGLRLSEVTKLRLRDIEPSPEKTLFIVENRFGTNKSASARRQLPFAALLRDDERQAFHAYELRRRRDGGEALLIVDPASGAPVKSGWLSKTVTLALNHVLGGSGWTFHHLRHAAANNLFLVLEGEGELASSLNGWDQNEQRRVRKAVLGDEHARQKRYTALATFMGHAVPVVTFQSYIHLVEPVMAARRHRQPVARDLANYAAVLGVAPTRVAPLLLDGVVAKRVARKLRPWIEPAIRSAKKKTAANSGSVARDEPVRAASPEQCRAALRCIERGATIEEAAREANIDEASVERWVENARALAALKTKYGKPRLFEPDRLARAADNPELGELLLPTDLRSTAERRDCDLMFTHFREMWSKPAERGEAEWALGYALMQADPGKSGLPFRRPEDLVRFTSVFAGSAFSGKRWHVDLKRAGQMERWRHSIPSGATTREPKAKKSKTSLVRAGGHARLHLQLVAPEPSLGIGASSKRSAQTLRYVPHLLAIMTGKGVTAKHTG